MKNIPFEREDEIDGRYTEAVSEYASTCDGCGDLTMHEEMIMDDETQLGYCECCQKKRKPKIVKGETCLICGRKPSVYERVRHCRECHSKYNKKNYRMHRVVRHK
jgi:hypothetical protein